ncbi:MAG: extracellular solute-binding protein, partial [Atribacterales bacterium]
MLATSCMLLFVDFALSQEAITVIMPRHEMDIKGVWERQTREFEEKSGIKVELIQMAWERVADKIVTEMASGGSAFDVIEFDNVWPAKFLSAGWLISLNEFIDPATVDKILPGLVSTFSKDGHLYGMTWNNDTRFFMYNNEKLKNAGIAVPPKTWTEFTEQTKKLQTANLA